MAITCTRRLTFEAGHRVWGHESKCAHFHGHSYKVEVTASAHDPRRAGNDLERSELDGIGRVIDFSVLKAKVGGWIDARWDHAFLYNEKDTAARDALAWTSPREGELPRTFPLPVNPTAENLADYLLRTVCPRELEGTGVHVTHVRVWETENCYADANL